jgi:hypothetical protein
MGNQVSPFAEKVTASDLSGKLGQQGLSGFPIHAILLCFPLLPFTLDMPLFRLRIPTASKPQARGRLTP